MTDPTTIDAPPEVAAVEPTPAAGVAPVLDLGAWRSARAAGHARRVCDAIAAVDEGDEVDEGDDAADLLADLADEAIDRHADLLGEVQS